MSTQRINKFLPSQRPIGRVAIIGRPNVGKSTLINRIVGKQVAIVDARPGVTRDQKILTANWQGFDFEIIDTGGWLASGGTLEGKISDQAESAAKQADLIIFMTDVTVGITDEDQAVADMLRRFSMPVIQVVNKADSPARDLDAWEFLRLGFGEPLNISALHGRLTGDLLDRIVTELQKLHPDQTYSDHDSGTDETEEFEKELSKRTSFSVAIVGRPNVGKSTLFNRLIGDERSITHDQAGTTTDSVDTVVETEIGTLKFIDTAGMRRKSRIEGGTEYYSMVRTLRSIDEADVSLLVIDGTQGVTHQDQRLAERIDAAGSPVVVLLNKWDLLTTEEKLTVNDQVDDRLAYLSYAPVLRISALSGLGVTKLWRALSDSIVAYRNRIPTRELNVLLQQAQAKSAPRGSKILYGVQGATDPPTFTLFTTKELSTGYLRYLERQLRERFALGPTPIKLRVRRRSSR
ncbi:MAG: ribosome biogenesis GTPase Der [Actinomycetota bacterium]|nr:ribosome biogenesis GTPase Der [Actinomycetota bacterium]